MQTKNIFLIGSSGGRLAGFYVFVSTVPRADGKDTCYSDLTSNPSRIIDTTTTTEVNVTCTDPMTGRYVTIYNARSPGNLYPQGYSSYAILELCEVEVHLVQASQGIMKLSSRMFYDYVNMFHKIVVYFLRPISPDLPCVFSTFHLENPSVRFVSVYNPKLQSR